MIYQDKVTLNYSFVCVRTIGEAAARNGGREREASERVVADGEDVRETEEREQRVESTSEREFVVARARRERSTRDRHTQKPTKVISHTKKNT